MNQMARSTRMRMIHCPQTATPDRTVTIRMMFTRKVRRKMDNQARKRSLIVYLDLMNLPLASLLGDVFFSSDFGASKRSFSSSWPRTSVL